MLNSAKQWTVMALVLTGSGFALYTGATGPFEAPVQRGFFMLVMLPLIFLVIPSGLLKNETAETIAGFVLAAVSLIVMTWLLFDFERLYSELFIAPLDVWLGVIGIMLVLESVRRTVGLGITVILIVLLEFAYLGDRIPIDALRHGGLDIETIVSIIFYSTDGVFGTPIGVCATFIVVIIMLGAFLTATGAAELFMNIARAVAGRRVGGPAKIAVVGSALMGMITGATVANIATTGSVTIPISYLNPLGGYDIWNYEGSVNNTISSWSGSADSSGATLGGKYWMTSPCNGSDMNDTWQDAFTTWGHVKDLPAASTNTLSANSISAWVSNSILSGNQSVSGLFQWFASWLYGSNHSPGMYWTWHAYINGSFSWQPGFTVDFSPITPEGR